MVSSAFKKALAAKLDKFVSHDPYAVTDKQEEPQENEEPEEWETYPKAANSKDVQY